MNMFGSFTFGNLIKTVLPGLIWLIGLCMLEADIASLLDHWSYAGTFIWAYPEASMVLAVPAAILLGVVSNVIVFMGLNDWLVRTPVQTSPLHKPTHDLYSLVCEMTRTFNWEPVKTETIDTHNISVDAEVLVLHELGVPQLSYVREQYWYYVEFLMNLMLSLWALALAFVLRFWIIFDLGEAIISTLVAGLLTLVLSVFLVKAARKNYAKHLAKMLSLILSVLSKQQRAAVAARQARQGS